MRFDERIWENRVSRLSLHEKRLDVWYGKFESFLEKKQQYETYLSFAEQTRIKQFYFDRDRLAFIIAHGALRFLLARYLNREPSEFKFRFNLHQKPFLDEDSLQFNLTHTRSAFAIAITKKSLIGIDMECFSRGTDWAKLIPYALSEQEQNYIYQQPCAEQPLAFYRCWTRKEAYLKALGIGLTQPLKKITLTFNPPTKGMNLFKKNQWSIVDLPDQEDQKIALCFEKKIESLRFYK